MYKSKIEQLILNKDFSYSHPYFYNHPYALRCELGIGDDDHYLLNAKKRALEIYTLLFPYGADAVFFNYYITDYSNSGPAEKDYYDETEFCQNDYMSSLINTETEKIRFLLEYQWKYRHCTVKDLETEYVEETRRNRIVCFSDNKGFDYDSLIDMQISGKGQDISFVSFENECILSIYDDRGCDIVFTSPDKMKEFYHKIEPYFLPYDAEEMKKRFDN